MLRRRPDLGALLDDLSRRGVNYDEAGAPPAVTDGWNRDRQAFELGREHPGEPEPDGLMATAGRLVNSYEFSDPAILRAAFRHPGDLVGRDMMLEGRFLVLRFLMGVRITDQHDEVGDGPNGPERRVGWSYQTLDGHIEQGRLTYEVAKELHTGRVEFRIIAYSRRAPIRNPIIRIGFRLFARRTQLRFYRNALRRLRTLLQAPPPTPGPRSGRHRPLPHRRRPRPVRGLDRPHRRRRAVALPPRPPLNRLGSARSDPPRPS